MTTLITDKMASAQISSHGLTTGIHDPTCQMTRYLLIDTMGKNEALMDYTIKKIEPKDKPEVLAFLKRFFFRDEPLNDSIKLIPEGETSCPPLEKYSMSSIEENLSLMAVSSTGSIVGVLLNGTTVEPEDTDEPDFIKECDHQKFRKILKLLHHVDREANVVKRYPGKKILDIKIISVDNNWRGKGIAAELFKKTMKIAKELNYDYVRCDCSSHFTSKLCKRLGFEEIFELKYKDYLDHDGKPVFTPVPPHDSISTCVSKL